MNGEEVEGEGRKLLNSDRIELGGASGVHWLFREIEATISIPRPRVE